MKRFLVVLIGVVSMGVFANQALAAVVDPGGYIEVCKAANPLLHGSYNFSVRDSATTDESGPTHLVTSSISLTPGTCTAPIAVHTGSVKVTEDGGTLGLSNGGTTTVDNAFFTTTATAVGQNSAPTGTFDGHWTYNGQRSGGWTGERRHGDIHEHAGQRRRRGLQAGRSDLGADR